LLALLRRHLTLLALHLGLLLLLRLLSLLLLPHLLLLADGHAVGDLCMDERSVQGILHVLGVVRRSLKGVLIQHLEDVLELVYLDAGPSLSGWLLGSLHWLLGSLHWLLGHALRGLGLHHFPYLNQAWR
jgi:hypothetical protein